MSFRASAFAIVVVLAACLPSPAALAQSVDPARLAAAKEMMAASGVERQFEQVMPVLLDRLRDSFRSLAPDRRSVIDSVFEQMQGKFVARRGELLDEIAGIYAKTLSVDEMSSVTAFYRSPVGSKLISVQPDIMRESMAAGQRWGQRIGQEIEEEARRELKKRGVEL